MHAFIPCRGRPSSAVAMDPSAMKAVDEALYLSFAIQNSIIALGQGLFMIHVAQAPMWNSTADRISVGMENIAVGRWINACVGPVPFEKSAYKEPDSSVWLAPKFTDIKKYPANHFQAFIAVSRTDNKFEGEREFGYLGNQNETFDRYNDRIKNEGGLEHKYSGVYASGGAIGSHTVVFDRHGSRENSSLS